MRRLRVIGIGPGGRDQLTVEAVEALNDVDVFLLPDKGIPDLVALREEILVRHVRGSYRLETVPDPPRDRSPTGLTGYGTAVSDWHEARTVLLERVIAQLPEEVGGILVWGDPSLYDSTLRIVDGILARGNVSFDHDVVPGVSSVCLLAARHRIVLHRVGEPVTVTTGRRLLDTVAPASVDNVVVMLDGDLTCASLDTAGWDIWWGANLGTADEALVAGRLSDVLPDIRAARSSSRQARGWVMDTYLLRRRSR
ncbi:MAG TPA: precorrin-6A synthase (deacetylating) [Nocardioidaceae bacterium]|nr:precorrin-6A synthase (deacetylating) [Nocardioidaceae bacterium]